MIVSKFNLKNIQCNDLIIPDQSLFELPEKVLQFGTGVLLRGLPDYFIDKANRQGKFNGRIVVVKSTDGGDGAAFDKQDGLYTLCVRGIENGKVVEENILNSSISRVLSAKSDWKAVKECAHNPELQIVISNTTEVGIELVSDDIRIHPPVSFPGKLLAFLHERYKAFAGSEHSGLVIVPTELISNNGKKLESIVIEQAHLNGLDDAFIDWLENHNTFCNTLVDRIVPGKPSAAAKEALQKKFGYDDDLITMSEVYRLWAIEGDEKVKAKLSFAEADSGVVIVPNIDLFKELKLRLLNGTHTLSCGLAFLAGFDTVKKAMDDTTVSTFISNLMTKEIAPAIPYKVDAKEAQDFATKVLDRFRNPNIEHQWISITMNYTSKLEMRVLPVLQQYYKLFNAVPEHFALGFAAYMLFNKPVKKEGDVYYGELNGVAYPIKDDKAATMYKKWQETKSSAIAEAVLHDTALWGGTDLSVLPGFAESVQEKLNDILVNGITAVIKETENKKVIA
ncbi:tagaturonate reductase [Ferruginibacter albus]|uniref:tagaturonate reductase n=1 Tax=Ferruginibacter albus TaxID=2875540 RepID=UPI001CC3F547|nr:tagaturonate reductase [Ferruginibacter albus]UAY50605.1 tagaturonate reductase [Ferruginibacter albus]